MVLFLIDVEKKTGPESRPSSIFMRLIPVYVSPYKMADCIGDAPLHFGSKEA